MMADAVQELISQLDTASTQSDRRGKAFKTEFVIQNLSKKPVQIDSWRFNEWDYGKDHKIKLPCKARGLFTSINSEGKPYIVTRGYDKFFSIDEMPFTKWEAIEQNTTGPYEVSLKENGCIIFITGLEDGTLVVCSKHSVGVRDDVNKNHAIAGENFLRKQLGNDEDKIQALAKQLYSMNCTAVAEYCDDSFEEHVLEYSTNKAGLYLHGLNKNTKDFQTLPMSEVDEFAKVWEFQKIEFFNFEKLNTLKQFVEKCAETGCYNNQEIEGFVIRSQLKDKSQPFFFKFKFEEPYLMYRQWREVTKEYIKTRQRVFKFNRHKFITNQYLDFVIPMLEEDPQLCEDYLNGFGIIKLRKLFLTKYGMSGMEILNLGKIKELEEKNSIDYEKIDQDTKFLLVPISTIGCGKTTTSLVLCNLFPETFGHVQNDDITGKDKAQLIKRSLELLKSKKCVVVDRNNHQYLHRKQIFQWVQQHKEEYLPYDTNIQIIAVPFFDYSHIDKVFKITTQRVLDRGDNHQSIKLSSEGEKKVLGIMNGFLKHFQKLDLNKLPDSQFDNVIQGLDVTNKKNSSLLNAKIIIKALNKEYSSLVPEIPTEAEFLKAFDTAMDYKPTVVKIVKNNEKKKKAAKPVYFGLKMNKAEVMQEMVSKLLECVDDNDLRLKVERGLISEFHVTLCHTNQVKNDSESRELYEKYMEYVNKANIPSNGQNKNVKELSLHKTYSVYPKEIIWNKRIATVLVDLEDSVSCANNFPHVSLSVLDGKTKPFYSNTLAESYKLKITDEGDIKSISLANGICLKGQLYAYY